MKVKPVLITLIDGGTTVGLLDSKQPVTPEVDFGI